MSKGLNMNVADKINYLLEEKGITKREFAQKLLSLNPLLDRTGKAPSESTIYGYLNGGREIKIELIAEFSIMIMFMFRMNRHM